MGYLAFTTAEFKQDKPISSTTMGKIRNNIEWLKQAYQYNLTDLSNRDFELHTAGVPDLWTCSTYEDGYAGINTSTSYSGKSCLMFVHSGGTRSGGEAISDYVPISTISTPDVYIYYNPWGDTAFKYQVKFIQYTRDLTPISTLAGDATWLTISTPGVLNVKATVFAKAAGARWARVKFQTATGAGDTEAGTLYIDNVYWKNVHEYEY